MVPFTPDDYKKRIDKMIRRFPDHKLDAFLIEDSINLYYLTGLQLSAGRLLVDRKGCTLFVDGRYAEYATEKAPCTVSVESDLDVGVVTTLSVTKKEPHSIGFLSDCMVYSRLLRLKELSGKLITGQTDWIPCIELLKQIREIKEEKEVERLRISAQFAVDALELLIGELKEGIKERDLDLKLRQYCLEYNGTPSFDPIIAFGENSSRPHGRVTDRALKKGDVVQFDLGVEINHYQSDISRIFFFGVPHEKILSISKIVKKAQEAAFAKCRPSVPIVDVERAARNVIEEAGYGQFFPHSLGHGVGLEVHENPTLRRQTDERAVLKEGMVITIEPGIYIPGLGGVRIEDTLLINHDGHEILTKGAPC